MFAKLTLFRIAALPVMPETNRHGEDSPAFALRYVPAGPTQELAYGFVPPRRCGALLEQAPGGNLLARIRVETRTVPKPAIDKAAAKMAEAHERDNGRKPGRKALREMKDAAKLELLPRAFPRVRDAFVLVDVLGSRVWIGATTSAVVDAAITLLTGLFQGMTLDPVVTETRPSAAMAHWLLNDPPQNMNIEESVNLADTSAERRRATYRNITPDAPEIVENVERGMHPVAMAMTRAGRISFTLHDDLTLTGVELLDVAVGDEAGPEVDAFDADVAIWTAEVSALLRDLIDAMGGEFVPMAET